MTNTTQIPDNLIIALGQYFLNCALQTQTRSVSFSREKGANIETTEVVKRDWDKEADLKRIFDIVEKMNWGCEAIAGGFWFYPSKEEKLFTKMDIWPSFKSLEKDELFPRD